MADVSIATGAARAVAAAPTADVQRSALAWLLAAIAMVLALMAPALWNGFPIIFPDTGGYLERPIEGTLAMGRSALFGLYLYAGSPFAFWPYVIAQAALAAWLIALGLRVHGLGARPGLALGIVATLSVGTSLPWVAGTLMPDFLFPAAVLAIHLLAFQAGELARWERYGLAAVIAFAIPSHMAAAGMCVALTAALWLLARVKLLALPQARLSFAIGAVAAGIALCPISNLAITGKLAFTPGGSSFLFGRLIEDGIVGQYLHDRCPDPALRLCAYKGNLPEDADGWLWGDDSPFYSLGGWAGFGEEERDMILATLPRYPLMHATTAIEATVEQLLSFQTEVSLEDNAPTYDTFAEHMPRLAPHLMSARQQAGRIDVGLLNLVHTPLAAVAIIGLAGALMFRRRLDIPAPLAALCVTILLALAANAAICGIFSHAVDRYQSRLVALAPFALLLILASRWRTTRLGTPGDLA
jgi:hypothetical protein